MKKSGGIIFAIILAFFMSTAPSFAEGLNLVNNYPEEGSNASPPANLGIKLFFDNNVSSRELREQNESCFKLIDDEGKAVPLKVLYTDADPNYILVIAEPEDEKLGLGSDREYRFEIAQELQALDGSTLDAPESITFRTRNSSMDMTINMVIMGVMVAGMLVFSTISMRRQMKKSAASDEKQKVNPYKVAKETGKNVTDIVAQEDKKKQKVAKKNAAKGDRNDDKSAVKDGVETAENVDRRRVKRVKGPRPVSAAGSSYKSGRKAAAEKRAREEAERLAKGTTKPKNKSAGSKKKKK
ncbi:MAG: hypothetical protein LBK57_02330 [Clostridiales Family XIII bacterium]|jgi:hypothetical protein|nr:hypothetical protein [Clostridiales Family XIII bacterium]